VGHINEVLHSYLAKLAMIWKTLPDDLRDPACGSDSFKQFLKTIMFSLY